MDKNIYNKKYYRADKAAEEILNAIEQNLDSTDCKEFEKIVSSNHFSKELLDDMVDVDRHRFYFDELKNTGKETDVKRLMDGINSLKRRTARRRMLLTATAVAAAMIAISFVLLVPNRQEVHPKIMLTEVQNSEIKEPILIVDTGDTIPIDKHGKYEEYLKRINGDRKMDPSTNRYNTVIIPVGFTHHLLLPDGTKVTLNAGSRLKYPTVFSGATREVELTGEAYFDVTKSDKKFVVNSSTSKIEVFGTQFNVRSKRNGDVEAVLVEGSIGFKPLEGDLFMVTPGTKLSYVSEKNRVTTQGVDTYTYTAWLDNKFVYKDESLVEVMNDIATWYGISVSSAKEIGDLTLTLVIDRDTPIDDLMRVLSLTLNIKIIKEKGMDYTIE